MPIIKLETYIDAPIELVFDLARSIDIHKLSTKGSNEEAIAGKTSGLIELGETVTWRAKHFGVYQKLTVKITQFDQPNMFEDTMLKGAFKQMKHTHRFEKIKSGTKMTDHFEFVSPLGLLGRLADSLFLRKYMTQFLMVRNQELKCIAESDEWKKIIHEKREYQIKP